MPKLERPFQAKAAGTPLDVDRDFYERLAQQIDTRKLVDQFVVPIRDGRAWPVRAGQICRIVTVEGPSSGGF